MALTIPLKDLCAMDITDGTHKTPTYADEGYIFLSSKNVTSGVIDWDNVMYIPDSLHNELYKRVAPQKNDILLAKNGTTGVAAIVDRDEVFDIYVSLALIRPDETKVLPRYLLHAINSYPTKQFFDSHLKGIGVPNLHLTHIRETPIRVPSFTEQKQITDVLDKVDELIALRKEQLAKLDELVKARFVEMFGDPVYNPNRWKTETVESVCKEIYGGGTPSKSHPEYYENGDIPWVSSKDMKTDILSDSQIRINQLGVDNSTAKMVPVNSVVMVIRSGILKHTLPVAINIVPITVNQDLKVFIPGADILPLFMMFQFKMLEKDILSGVRAVTADNIEFNTLKQREIMIPPLDIQHEFAAFVEQTNKTKLTIQASLDKLEVMKKALMQEYFG